jgi:DNA gyrase/topoisomerase IV subunit A
MSDLVSVSITSELISDFLTYSTAIYNRALPHILDGLKITQRRLLVSMKDLDLRSDGRYVKVSRLDGICTSTYSPHGSSASTAIGMGQQSALRYVLTDIHGNCGGSIQTGDSIGQMVSEDPPAASRYLEVKSSHLAEILYLDQIRAGIGQWNENYDSTKLEPSYLVPPLPALLLTGAQGIASGYACHHISYNMRDVINATCAWIKNKKLTDSQFLAKFINPPEPPQGGRIVRNKKIAEMIRGGVGQITAYGEWEMDDNLKWGKRSVRPALMITRLASGSSEKFLEKVRDLADAEKLPGLIDAADHSSRDGIRIVLVTKTTEDRAHILNVLLTSNTGLKHLHNVSCVAVGLDGKPVTVGAREAIEVWYGERVRYLTELHRKEIEKLRAKYDKLEAVLKILADLDKFLKIVRGGKDKDQVVDKVVKTWKLPIDLAKHVIGIPISTLIATELSKVKAECETLEVEIAKILPLCSEGGELDTYICDQITALRPLCGPARSVWMSEGIPETPQAKPAVKGERERIVEEGKALGLTARAVNKWLKENLGTGKLTSRWEEYKAEYVHRLQMTTRKGKKERKQILEKIRSSAETKGLPKRGKWAWKSFIDTCNLDRIDVIRDKMEEWLTNLPNANVRPSQSDTRAVRASRERGGKKAGNKQPSRAKGTERRTGGRKPRSRAA